MLCFNIILPEIACTQLKIRISGCGDTGVKRPSMRSILLVPFDCLRKSENQRKENINQTKPSQNANSRDSTTVLNMTDNISEEINVNTSLNSCLYLHADLLSTNSKLLLDTGSPYSILSTKMYLKLQSVVCLNRTNNDVKLKAADGSYINLVKKFRTASMEGSRLDSWR